MRGLSRKRKRAVEIGIAVVCRKRVVRLPAAASMTLCQLLVVSTSPPRREFWCGRLGHYHNCAPHGLSEYGHRQ
jgi:hypothetical protein